MTLTLNVGRKIVRKRMAASGDRLAGLEQRLNELDRRVTVLNRAVLAISPHLIRIEEILDTARLEIEAEPTTAA